MATKKAALRCVLSEKLRENQLVLLESLELPTHRTKDLAAAIAKLGVTGKALLLDRRENENLAKAARNNPNLFVEDALGLDAYAALEATTRHPDGAGPEDGHRGARMKTAAVDHPEAHHHREVDDAARDAERPDVQGRHRREQDRDPARRRGPLQRQGRLRPRPEDDVEDQEGRALHRPDERRAEGLREAEGGREAAADLRGGLTPCRFAPTSPRPPVCGSGRPATSRRSRGAPPRRASPAGKLKTGRPEQPRPAHLLVARRRPQAPLPRHRLQARQVRHPGEGRLRRVRPEPLGPHRADPLRGRREALHHRAAGLAVGQTVVSGPDGRHPHRERAPAEVDPARHGRPQRRADARQGRPDGPLGRRRRPGHGQGRRALPPPHALGRAPQGPRRLLRDRSGRSGTSSTRTSRSARRAGTAGWAGSPTTAASR